MIKTARNACTNASAIMGITTPYVNWGLKYANTDKAPTDRDFPFTYIANKPGEDAISISKKLWDSYDIREQNISCICCFLGAIGRQFDLEPVL